MAGRVDQLSKWIAGVSLALFAWIGFARAESPAIPLHASIDAAVESELERRSVPPAGRSDDAEFLRRVYLDLWGTIPTAAAARAFLADSSPDKRTKLIDELLGSPEYARHMARVFDVMLMERRPDKHVPAPAWREYLRKSFAEKKSWDVLVREIVSADGADESARAPAKFYLDRNGEPHEITRDVGRLFLGVDLQCAQCHDHPLVDGYPQDWYYGIFAFFNRSFVFTDKKKNNLVSLAEKADGEATYTSVFDPSKTQKTGLPHLLDRSPLPDPTMEKGKEYEVAPADGVRPIPKYSRRAQLASQLTSPDLPAFAQNIANRLWAQVMGRGLVHPIDMHHPDNEASHPEVLDQLAERLVASKFDLPGLLRELALSDTYQRSSIPPTAEEMSPEIFAVAQLKPLTPEQLAWSMMQATGHTDAQRAALGAKLNEQTLHDSLAGGVAAFASTFGGLPGEAQARFEATLDQALFLKNGSPIRDWLAPRAGNLVDRLTKLTDPKAMAEELYLSTLTRMPSDDESAEVSKYLADRPDAERTAAIQELVWAMITSAEFRFNH